MSAISINEEAARAAGADDEQIALIRKLREVAAKFEAELRALEAVGPAVARSGDNALMLEFGEKMRSAEQMKARINWTLAQVDKAIAAAHDIFGLGALGFLPLLAGLGLLGLIAAVGYVTLEMQQFRQSEKVISATAAELERRGVPPDEAQRRARSGVVPSSLSFTGMIGLLAALAFGALLLRRGVL